MKPLKHKIASFLVRWCSPDVQLWDAVVTLHLVLGCFCFPYLLWIVVLVFGYRLLECLRGNVGWSFPGGFCRYAIREQVRCFKCSTQPTTSGPHHTQVQDPVSIYKFEHHHTCSEKIWFFLHLLHHLLNFSVSCRNTLTEHDIVLLNKNDELEDSWFHFSVYPPGRCQQYSINSSKCGQRYKHRYDPSHVAVQAVGKCLWRQQNNSYYAAL